MNFKLKNNKGVTLLEVIISVALVSTISIGFFMTINNTKRSNTKNDKDLKAMDIAQSEIEYIIKDIKDGDDVIKIGNEEIKLEDIDLIEDNNKNKEPNIEYEKNHSDKDNYDIKVWLGKTEENQQVIGDYYLYNVEVIAKSKSDFSDREVKLQTEVLQKLQ